MVFAVEPQGGERGIEDEAALAVRELSSGEHMEDGFYLFRWISVVLVLRYLALSDTPSCRQW